MAFKKGQSGNPAGKPKGTRDWRSKLREQLEEAGPDVVRGVINQAKAGDLQAIKIVMDRLVPPLKSTSAPASIHLPASSGFLERAEAVFSAMAKGELPPDDAAALLGALANVMKAQEIDDLEGRIAAMERSVNK